MDVQSGFASEALFSGLSLAEPPAAPASQAVPEATLNSPFPARFIAEAFAPEVEGLRRFLPSSRTKTLRIRWTSSSTMLPPTSSRTSGTGPPCRPRPIQGLA